MKQVVAELRPSVMIDRAQRRQMFTLMTKYYEAVDESAFISDLKEKDFVILLTLDGALIGFSTALVQTAKAGGRTIRYLFSGDTVVSPEFWGPGYLLHSVFKTAGWIKAMEPEIPLYWFLIVKGHRTYRILTTFFRLFVPGNPDEIGGDLIAIRDTLGRARFGAYYDRVRGLIDFGNSRGHIAGHLQDTLSLAAINGAVRDFSLLNPDHTRGVELACIAEFSEANLRSYALRRFREGLSGKTGPNSDELHIQDPPPGLFDGRGGKRLVDPPARASTGPAAALHGG